MKFNLDFGDIMSGSALKVEYINFNVKVVTCLDTLLTTYQKYLGRVSKKRFKNIMKMANKRWLKNYNKTVFVWNQINEPKNT